MTDSIVRSSALEISNINGELVVDSRLIADRLGIEHATLLTTIDKYLPRLQSKKPVRFEIDVVKRPQGGTYNLRYAFLDERQSTLLMTLSRNTEQVLDCKEYLVDAFDRAKSIIKTVIPVQNDRIRELELQVRLAELNTVAVENASLLVAMHGESLGLTIAGLNVDQIIETKVPTTEVLNPVTGKCDEFLDAKQLVSEVLRRSGQKLKSNADFIKRLKYANRDDLILPVTRNATCEYVRAEDLDEAIDVVFGSVKQQLLTPSHSALV
jgi:phage regulator Rha-like protein